MAKLTRHVLSRFVRIEPEQLPVRRRFRRAGRHRRRAARIVGGGAARIATSGCGAAGSSPFWGGLSGLPDESGFVGS
jgi:hypothetical protein